MVDELKQMGHPVEHIFGYDRALFGPHAFDLNRFAAHHTSYLLGRGQIIRRMDSGVLWTGTDSRADGSAMGC